MPKPCNHKHPSKTKPTTKGTHPISCGLLALFAFPLFSFCKESSCFLKLHFFNLLSNPCFLKLLFFNLLSNRCFLKLLFFNLLSNRCFLSPCWLICKPLGLSLFCQTLLLQSFWLLFSFLHPQNAISSLVRHLQGQICARNLHHLNKKHWNHIGWQGNDFPPTILSICLIMLLQWNKLPNSPFKEFVYVCRCMLAHTSWKWCWWWCTCKLGVCTKSLEAFEI